MKDAGADIDTDIENICIYICMCIYIHIDLYIHTYIHIYIDIGVHISMNVYPYIHIHMYICIWMYIYTPVIADSTNWGVGFFSMGVLVLIRALRFGL